MSAAPTLAAPGDQGTGTYTASGTNYTFDLLNNGSTAWQYFFIIAPTTVSFVGGATAGESTAHCVTGEPGGLAGEIECGPLSATGLVPGSRVLLVVTTTTSAACGGTFQLGVSSTGAPSGAEATAALLPGSCAVTSPTSPVAPPRVVTRPAVHGTPVVGQVLTSAPPTWSLTPTRTVYQWELCTSVCRSIVGATRRTLRLTRLEAGHAVRLKATATVSGVELSALSDPVTIRTTR